jgi:hypothetical protein
MTKMKKELMFLLNGKGYISFSAKIGRIMFYGLMKNIISKL